MILKIPLEGYSHTGNLLLLFSNKLRKNIMEEKKELTDREKEILGLIKLGKNDIKISKELCISKHTAHSHRKSIYKKFNVHSNLEAIIKGIELGYLSSF